MGEVWEEGSRRRFMAKTVPHKPRSPPSIHTTAIAPTAIPLLHTSIVCEFHYTFIDLCNQRLFAFAFEAKAASLREQVSLSKKSFGLHHKLIIYNAVLFG